MGPTVITVPHLLEELFRLEVGTPQLQGPDFPSEVRSGAIDLEATSRYVQLIPLHPFYRIHFADGSFFDYDGDEAHLQREVARLGEAGDLEGYFRFQQQAQAIFQRGFLELGTTYFGDLPTMIRVVPELIRLDALRPLFQLARRSFQSPKLQQVFSFEPLLIGGNPLAVPALYAMIHFVERTWGVYFALGGTGALVKALVNKFQELGGELRLQAEVAEIRARPGGRRRGRVEGVVLKSGEFLQGDVVISNGDWVTTYRLIEPRFRFWNSETRFRWSRPSMSLFVIYFGFRADGRESEHLRHHNILLGPRYEELLREIFDRKILPKDFSQYLHLPTLTDPSLAPPGHHAAYTLVPVPHNGSGLDWELLGAPFAKKVLRSLEAYLPGLEERLVYSTFIDPNYFERTLNSYLGNAFGPEPVLWQSAYFRPHNRSEDLEGLYLVGANTQPGAGVPSVILSAKMTARLIAQDFGLDHGTRRS